MRDFISVFKLQLRNTFRKDRANESSKKFIAAVVGLALAYAVIAAAFIFIICMMGSAFAAVGLKSEFVALILIAGLFFVLIFGIVTVLTCLYFSKDTEFFLALPIRPSTVFAAKLFFVYFMELGITALIMLPCLIATGVVMHLPAIFYVIMPFAILLTPAIPLFFAAIIAIPVMFLVSFFRNRGALGSILVIILFGLFFVGYYFLVAKMQGDTPDEMDISAVAHIFRNICNTLYPLYALARAMTLAPVFGLNAPASVAVNLVIYIGSVAAIGVIAWLISAAVYRRGAASQLEGAKNSRVANAEYRSSGALKALMKKEWREIVRTPAFALNCFLGVVMCPIIVGFIGFSTRVSSIVSQAAEEGEVLSQQFIDVYSTIVRFVALCMIMFISVGTNAGPSTAFSREGEKLYFSKLMPVDYRTQIKAKSYIYIITGSVSSVLGAVALALFNFDLAFFICSVIFLLIYNYAAVHFAMWLDLRSPKLKWVTPNEAVKHNRNVTTTVFVSLLAALVSVAAACVIYFLFYRAGKETLGVVIGWIFLFVLAFVGAFGFTAMLYKDCESKMEAIEM